MSLLRTALISIPLGLSSSSGCSLVGTWSTVEIKPADARFPIASVTFADDGTYCISHTVGGRTGTSSGTYEWHGTMLVLKPANAPPARYAAYWAIGGRLIPSQRADHDRVTAVLERLEDQDTGTPP